MLDTTIKVKTDRFDGPLGLLLLLIQKEDMDIRELNLAEITKQYLGYLAQMQELNFNVAGDYLYLASTLLFLKSKSCLTEEEIKILQEDGEGLPITSQAELIKRLEELQSFQKLGNKLWSLPKKGHEIFVKPRVDRKAIVNSILTPMDISKLTSSMMEFMKKNKKAFTIIKKDSVSIKEKLSFLKTFLLKGQLTDFDEIIESDGGMDISNIVISLISLLELVRLNKIAIFQNELKSTIYVDVIESLENFNVDLVDEYDDNDDQEENGQNEKMAVQ